MLALSIRQPWAELILRGIKTIEYRSRPTRIIGQRFYIYASRSKTTPGRGPTGMGHALDPAAPWSRDLAMACGQDAPPAWMLEMMAHLLERRDLPTGVIVGSAVIEKVTPPRGIEALPRPAPSGPRGGSSGGRGVTDGLYRWHLADIQRASTLRKPDRHPQPVWFEPFQVAKQAGS